MRNGFRSIGGLALLLALAGCATTPRAVPTASIRGTLRVPSAAKAVPVAGMHGGHSSDAETPADAVIYIERIPEGAKRDAARSAGKPSATGEKPASSSGSKAKAKAASEKAARASVTKEKTPKRPSPAPGTKPHPSSAAASKPDAEAVAASRVVMGQVDHRFVPRVLPVRVGTTVHFENRDRVYHNVFSISPARRFDVGKYAPRQSRPIAFEKPGVVKLYCDIDPSMAGFVLVLPTSEFTQPDAAGGFVLPGLPRGAYALKVWHPTLGEKSRRVVIPAQGDAIVELEL